MKALVVLSGGLDSTILLYHLRALGLETEAFSLDYGQRHRRELEAASALTARLGVRHHHLALPAGLLGGSALTDSSIEVPEGHYAAESMKATVVPNRNMILLALAGGVAIANGCGVVAYGAHAGDHAIYPDCRPEFAGAMSLALSLCDWNPVGLQRPFISMTKADLVQRGWELGVAMGETWSCYKGGEVHCGACGTCVERREAFALAGRGDPTIYAPTAPELAEILSR